MAQASASKIRRRVRDREQVARFIADDGHARFVEGMHDGQPDFRGIANEIAAMSPRWSFDVHAARESAEALVRLEAEQAVFEDWTRERGAGPENRELGTFVEPARESSVKVPGSGPGAYGLTVSGVSVLYHLHGRASGEQVAHSIAVALSEQHPDQGATAEGDRVTFGRQRSGGWPGKLAREYAWKRCPNECEVRVVTFGLGPERDTRARCRVRPDGKICDCADGRVRHRGRDPRAPMGRALARLGRRVLAAIEGQPSECRGHRPIGDDDLAIGDGRALHYDMYVADEPFHLIVGNGEEPRPCPDCEGTGHNLRGTLAAVDLSPAVRRALADSAVAVGSVVDDYENLAPWQRPLVEALDMADEEADEWALFQGPETRLRVDTRVVPRGEHRIGPARGKDDPPWTLDQRINGRGWAPESKREAAEDMRLIFACSPAWRRGEVRAQETRARRAWEAVGEEWEGQSWMPPRAAAGPEAAE